MKQLIKYIPILALMAGNFAHGQDDGPKTMTEDQKVQVMELLKTLQNANMSRKMKVIAEGISALTPAASNESEAMALFERCYKKKEFDDNENKKDKDWREWKTKNKEKLNSAANKRALRYQVRWALVTLKAAMEPEETYDPAKYAPQAIAILSEVMRDTKVLEEASGPYNGSVINGSIGQVYELGGCKQQGWPDNIMDPFRVIEALILAPSRDKGDVSSMRKGWTNLIAMQKIKMDAEEKAAAAQGDNNGPGGNNGRRGGQGFRRNIENNIENLYWLCELDCYRAGDEMTSTANMVRIIKGTTDTGRQEMLINQLVGILTDKDEQNANDPRNRGVYGLMGMGRRPANNFGGGQASPAPAPSTTTPPASTATTTRPAPSAATTTPSVPRTVPASNGGPSRPAAPAARPAVPQVEEIDN